MGKQFDLIVFDWDGTLLDSAAAIVASIQAACLDLGLNVPDSDAARSVIGLGLRDALFMAVPDLSSASYEKMAERYRYHYLLRDRDLALFDGVSMLLAELSQRGFWLGVATGKSRRGLDRSMGEVGLASCFHATRCADECPSKPSPMMLFEIMSELGVGPERTLMIGDTTHDIQMAHNAGVSALAVSYGAHSEAKLASLKPLRIVNALSEVGEWLSLHA